MDLLARERALPRFRRFHMRSARSGVFTACALVGLLSGVHEASTQQEGPTQSPQLVHKDGLLVFPNVRLEQSAVPVESSANGPGSAGMRAYRDERTGKLRNATQEELTIEALQTPPSNK